MLMQNESAFVTMNGLVILWYIAYSKVYTLVYQVDLQVETVL